MVEPPPLLVVLGATAVGKTAFAATLAERLGGEVLSCDASCVYRGLDVGTAKPELELRQRIPHRLLDLCEPDEDFTLARWLQLAEEAIAELRRRDVPVLIAGGTGLYLRALLQGLVESPPPDLALRARLEERERRRPQSLHRLLDRLDPASAGAIPPGNQVRVVRALEHRLRTGRRLSDDQHDWARPPRYSSLKFGLHLPREDRERRIRSRVDAMLEAGLVDEVRSLLARGLPPDSRSLRAIGYRESVAHLQGRLPLEEMRERIVVATRQYAKRQDTWFRKEPGITWLEAPGSPEELPALVESVDDDPPPDRIRSKEPRSAPERLRRDRGSPMSVDKSPNIQNDFFNRARKDGGPVTIYLTNGKKLAGRIRAFDKYTVIVESNRIEQMLFKHAISTVAFNRPAVGASPGAGAKAAAAAPAAATPASPAAAEPEPEPAE